MKLGSGNSVPLSRDECRGGDEVIKPYISVWLMPQEAEAVVLRGIVDDLASEFGTYPFDPHLTIISSFYADPSDVDAVIEPLSGSQGSMAFEVDDVVVGDKMTKTLYVTFKPVQGFSDYCETYRSGEVTQGASIPAPHMSLMYKAGGPDGLGEGGRERLEEVATRVKARLLDQLPVVHFGSVELVTSKRTLTEDGDVLDYQTVRTYSL